MNVPQMRMDKATFLDWAETQEGRCELVGGRVVMMMRPVMAHAIITRNLLIGFDRRLDRGKWTVIPDFATDVGADTVRAPDVVVVPAGGDLKSRTTASPVLLAEILSPTTTTVDMGDKVSEYLGLPSLIAYLVLSQDEAKAWLWLRGPECFPPGPVVLVGADATISVPPLGLELPMAEVYAGVV